MKYRPASALFLRSITAVLPMLLSVVVSGALVTGCSSPEPEPEVVPAFFEHTVRHPGETYSIIASWYTGSANNWSEIARANPQIRPTRIVKGQTILIPRALLIRESALPAKMVQRRTPPPSTEPVAVPTPGDAATTEEKGAGESESLLPESAAPASSAAALSDGVAEVTAKEPTTFLEKVQATVAAGSSSSISSVGSSAESPVVSSPGAAPYSDDLQRQRDELLRELLQE